MKRIKELNVVGVHNERDRQNKRYLDAGETLEKLNYEPILASEVASIICRKTGLDYELSEVAKKLLDGSDGLKETKERRRRELKRNFVVLQPAEPVDDCFPCLADLQF